jgi:glutamate receptor, ionotropic, invertebrate
MLLSLNHHYHQVFINEVGNDVAQKAVDGAAQHIKNDALSVELTTIEGNRSDGKDFLISMCNTYEEMIKKKKPPHVILDATKIGAASEVVKSLSAALAIPTISASFGQEGDLRQWRDLTDKKKNYLLHVMPPADVMTEIVRSICIYMNITNVAILYDNPFIFDHKYTKLFQNLPIRYVITTIANSSNAITEQIQRLRKLNINNFFLVGKMESLARVLGNLLFLVILNLKKLNTLLF